MVFRSGFGGHDRDEPLTGGGGTLVGVTPWPSGSVRVVGVGRSFVAQPAGCEPVRSGQAPTEIGSGGSGHVFEDFAGDVAFQDAGDLTQGLALGESPRHVVTGFLVVFPTGEHDVEQRRVGSAGSRPDSGGAGRSCRSWRGSVPLRRGGRRRLRCGCVVGCRPRRGGAWLRWCITAIPPRWWTGVARTCREGGHRDPGPGFSRSGKGLPPDR